MEKVGLSAESRDAIYIYAYSPSVPYKGQPATCVLGHKAMALGR